ncbi:unnamed protein product [Moneuplotes crassus]|uniref:LITAF domain-containing protein n=1 Tax=Euplotes crassus TaxID=5936 RepID=A0AAD1XZH9_EUPCR|nr:unnamed protein product [Moneuplotes crassus]
MISKTENEAPEKISGNYRLASGSLLTVQQNNQFEEEKSSILQINSSVKPQKRFNKLSTIRPLRDFNNSLPYDVNEVKDPQNLRCIKCKYRGPTRIQKSCHSMQWFMVLIMCVCCCWCCLYIPFCLKETYKYTHYCSKCDNHLKTYTPSDRNGK